MTSHQNHAATEAFFTEQPALRPRPGAGAFLPAGADAGGRLLREDPPGDPGIARPFPRRPRRLAPGPRPERRAGPHGVRGDRHAQLSSRSTTRSSAASTRRSSAGTWTRGSEMSSKTVPKAYPEEKLGHFCIRDGQAGRDRVLGPADVPPAGEGPGHGRAALRGRAASRSTPSTGNSSGRMAQRRRRASRSTGRTRRSPPSTPRAAR